MSTCHLFFSGPTELEILQNLDEIVEQALPLDKLKNASSDVNTAKNFVLTKVTFCQSRDDVGTQLLSFSSVL